LIGADGDVLSRSRCLKSGGRFNSTNNRARIQGAAYSTAAPTWKETAIHIWPRESYDDRGAKTRTAVATETYFLSLDQCESLIEAKKFFEDTFPDVLKLIPDFESNGN